MPEMLRVRLLRACSVLVGHMGNRIANRIIAAMLLGVLLLLPNVAKAMPITQFDKLNGKDQDEYIAEMIDGAQAVLKDAGKPALAEQVRKLFATNMPGDSVSIGMTEFYRNLARARLADVRRSQTDPAAARLQVEDAFALTMKKNGIELPQTFFTVNNSFRPKYPPQSN